MPVFVTYKDEMAKAMADILRQMASYLDDGLIEIVSVEKSSREWLPSEWELKLVYKEIDPTKEAT